MTAIAAITGVPMRVLLGTEEAQLAGAQDTNAWDNRLVRRQHKTATPRIVRPVIDRLIAVGVLPPPKYENDVWEYEVNWPDLRKPSDMEAAELAHKKAETLAKYMQSGIDTLIEPFDFCLLYTSPSPRDATLSRMPSSA